MGFFARLFAKPDGRQTKGAGRASTGRSSSRSSKREQPAKAAPATAKASPPAGNGVYSVERSLTTLVRSGLKRQKTTSTTKEWRHGNCQVRHKSKAAATRCRNS